MTLADLLPRLDAVRARGNGRWSARCPAHADRTPSLSISEGERGLLLKCFAGCSLDEICAALVLRVADLYYDRRPDPAALAEARRRREAREHKDRAAGCHAETLRDAEQVILAARGLDIARWSNEQLDQAMGAIAAAHAVLSEEGDYYERVRTL
ncbi:hypothetical protein DNFV4_02820 [Nitrospira tepida]|uniref:DNA primase n=1 Tax=Nitrospira tepida TaxID=2973512 RepID=A0AA86N0M7_9BACT|nr:hypothetical protein [Nitrospira tepida]CAI4032390.1 hypothetical protein DNFV4_02820 [Nitrospira tepida]